MYRAACPAAVASAGQAQWKYLSLITKDFSLRKGVGHEPLGYDFARAEIARLTALFSFAQGTDAIYQLRATSPMIPADRPLRPMSSS
jgi:hypothetical protein